MTVKEAVWVSGCGVYSSITVRNLIRNNIGNY